MGERKAENGRIFAREEMEISRVEKGGVEEGWISGTSEKTKDRKAGGCILPVAGSAVAMQNINWHRKKKEQRLQPGITLKVRPPMDTLEFSKTFDLEERIIIEALQSQLNI